MKLLIISILIYSCQLSVIAQEPRPYWVRNTPFPPADANYIFVYGMGIGRTEHDAEFSAWKNALYKALNEGGLVGIETQSKTLDHRYETRNLYEITSHTDKFNLPHSIGVALENDGFIKKRLRY